MGSEEKKKRKWQLIQKSPTRHQAMRSQTKKPGRHNDHDGRGVLVGESCGHMVRAMDCGINVLKRGGEDEVDQGRWEE